ncbi:MAG: GNAT family N-acetyltransferase [Rickettsiales bacterium]|jgi:hypothetical protein|nr:GNAT family N-acetyltransferase [Rickettsiales bacterium]
MRLAMQNSSTERLIHVPAALVINKHTPDDSISEEYLIRRFSRTSSKPEQVVYELTRDPGLLHQYFRLREQMFISVWGLKHFSGGHDAYDDSSDIMVARVGNHVIGGCRLTFANNRGLLLPMEQNDFILEDMFSELSLHKVKYAEISRMAILPEYQNSIVLLELSRQLMKCAANQKARYAFTMSPVPLARNYRKAASLFGINWKIRNDIHVDDREEFEGIKMVLSMVDLAPVYRPMPKAKSDVGEAIALVGA